MQKFCNFIFASGGPTVVYGTAGAGMFDYLSKLGLQHFA